MQLNSLLKCYDDGTQEVFPLFLNVTGEYQVCGAVFKTYSEYAGKYAAIVFPAASCIVWCEKGKAFTRKNLYRWFREAGINFCVGAKQTEIEAVLYDRFISEVQKPVSVLSIEEMAGWNRKGEWQSAEGYSFPGFPFLPCARKKFPYVQKDKKQLEQFFAAFAKIKNLNYRIIMLETLVYGVLSSILMKEGWTESYFLNFVLTEDIPEEWFCRLYQVFDREKHIVLSAFEKNPRLSMWYGN